MNKPKMQIKLIPMEMVSNKSNVTRQNGVKLFVFVEFRKPNRSVASVQDELYAKIKGTCIKDWWEDSIKFRMQVIKAIDDITFDKRKSETYEPRLASLWARSKPEVMYLPIGIKLICRG